jgi:hypothetical protein
MSKEEKVKEMVRVSKEVQQQMSSFITTLSATTATSLSTIVRIRGAADKPAEK